MLYRLGPWGTLFVISAVACTEAGFSPYDRFRLLWDLPATEEAAEASRMGALSFRPFAFSPGGDRLVVSNIGDGAMIVDAYSGVHISALALGLPLHRPGSGGLAEPVIMGQRTPIYHVAWEGDFIVFACIRFVTIWSVGRNRILYIVDGQHLDADTVAASVSSKRVLAVGYSGRGLYEDKIDFFDIGTGRTMYHELTREGSLYFMLFGQDGGTLITCGRSPSILIFDTPITAESGRRIELGGEVHEAVYHCSGDSIIATHGHVFQCFETNLSRVHLGSGKILATYGPSDDISPHFAYDAKTDTIAHLDRDFGSLVFRDGRSLKEIGRYPIEKRGHVSQMRFSPRGDLLAIAYSDSSVAVYTLGRLLSSLNREPPQ